MKKRIAACEARLGKEQKRTVEGVLELIKENHDAFWALYDDGLVQDPAWMRRVGSAAKKLPANTNFGTYSAAMWRNLASSVQKGLAG